MPLYYDPGGWSEWLPRYDAHVIPTLPGGSASDYTPHGGNHSPGFPVFPASDMPGMPLPRIDQAAITPVAAPAQVVNALPANNLAPLLVLGVVALLLLKGSKRR